MARYKDAIDWIVQNDDTEWVEHDPSQPDGIESITASLVADVFNKTINQVRDDIIHCLKQEQNR